MRIWLLIRADLRFQWKYGFYAVYAVFTLVYLLALYAVPVSARATLAVVLIFTDPAAMGLFFMGAMVLLEKSQAVNCALAASPVSPWEYCLAKLLSLAVTGLLVAAVLAVAGGIPDLLSCLAGVALASLLCSACGMIAAMSSPTLNRFVLLALPFELFICLPPALLLLGIDHWLLMAHPGAAAVWLICGDAPDPALCLLSLTLWTVPAWLLSVSRTKGSFMRRGGADL